MKRNLESSLTLDSEAHRLHTTIPVTARAPARPVHRGAADLRRIQRRIATRSVEVRMHTTSKIRLREGGFHSS